MSLPLESGYLNIYKNSGLTSYDCIRVLKRIYRARDLTVPKIGHLGTLDPLAEGVLPVAIGASRKLIRFFKAEKVYLAVIRLGLATDTDDIQGRPVGTADASSLEDGSIIEALRGFIGEIDQVPPKFSAVMTDGMRAYKRARHGEDFILESKRVYVRDAEFLGWDAPYVQARFVVGPGTYIRSIARDLGDRLGVGGCVASLKRESDGPFIASDAIDLDELESEGLHSIQARLLPPDFILVGWPRIDVSKDEGIAFSQGKVLTGKDIPPDSVDGFFAVYDHDGFIGIGTMDADGGLKPYRVIRLTI